MTFFHGVHVVEDNSGTRPINQIDTSIIGIIGTAPDADETAFPLDTAVRLLPIAKDVAKLGTTGTLRKAIDLIHAQAGATVVVVRVDHDDDENALAANAIGTTNADGMRTGMQALRDVNSRTHLEPKILIAPDVSANQAVATALAALAKQMQAFAYIDATGTDAEAINHRKLFDSKRLMACYPAVQYFDAANASIQICGASAVFAGVRAMLDAQAYGFKHSVSNQVINGITGLVAPITFQMQDSSSQANLLNADEVSTIVRIDGGFRTWGNRTCASDSKFAFASRVRIDDTIQQSIVRSHLWAVDKNITRTYFEDVTGSVQRYLDELKSPKAQVIVDGNCWVDPSENTPTELEKGQATIRYDFADSPIAETVSFYRTINSDYYQQLVI